MPEKSRQPAVLVAEPVALLIAIVELAKKDARDAKHPLLRYEAAAFLEWARSELAAEPEIPYRRRQGRATQRWVMAQQNATRRAPGSDIAAPHPRGRVGAKAARDFNF